MNIRKKTTSFRYCYCDMFRLLRVAVLREHISQNKHRVLKISSSFVNGTIYQRRYVLLELQCSSVSIISPLLHTDISFIYHRLWISVIESISKWNTSPSFRGRLCRPCGNLVISPQIELIVTTVLCYSESGFRTRIGENFCKANSSVIQSVREWLVSSFASRVIWRCVELST